MLAVRTQRDEVVFRCGARDLGHHGTAAHVGTAGKPVRAPHLPRELLQRALDRGGGTLLEIRGQRELGHDVQQLAPAQP